jgi:hypothetical protein
MTNLQVSIDKMIYKSNLSYLFKAFVGVIKSTESKEQEAGAKEEAR